MRKLIDIFWKSSDEPIVMDDVRPKSNKKQKNWWNAAIKKAAVKYGKPFKCGPTSLDREVLVNSKWIVVKGGEAPDTSLS